MFSFTFCAQSSFSTFQWRNRTLSKFSMVKSAGKWNTAALKKEWKSLCWSHSRCTLRRSDEAALPFLFCLSKFRWQKFRVESQSKRHFHIDCLMHLWTIERSRCHTINDASINSGFLCVGRDISQSSLAIAHSFVHDWKPADDRGDLRNARQGVKFSDWPFAVCCC